MSGWRKYGGGNLSLIPTRSGDVIMSVMPRFAEMFRQGKKDVEVRRRFPAFNKGVRVYFYEISPAKRIQMEAKIQSIDYLDTKEVWEKASHGMTEAEFGRYLDGCDICVAIRFYDWMNYSQPLPLPDNFRPPVSWRYAPKEGF